MGLLDIGLIALLIIAFISGARKGLFVALASFIGLVVGIYCALYFSDYIGDYLIEWFEWDSTTTNAVAFGITFLTVLIVISMAGKVLTKIANLAFLGTLNKLLGGFFEVLAMAFILSVIFMLINAWDSTEDLISDESKAESKLYEPIESIAPRILPFILNEVDELQEEVPSLGGEQQAAR
ncbi:CvpA family protein [Aureitalea marina]|uniref:Colicin V production protein n=1 Tax=Aureitalea marina TaxID=930804 RepID=A0A2S7KRX0_9FLAO|nr:CvpA family protein [Aureitalea marina]PQB05328.1 hypothetical protein BST85_10850 [Aureitalea marina]